MFMCKVDEGKGQLDKLTKTPAPVRSGELLSDALKGLVKLIEDGDLVRNTESDGDVMVFLNQGLRITRALMVAQKALEQNKSDNDKGQTRCETHEAASPNAHEVERCWQAPSGPPC